MSPLKFLNFLIQIEVGSTLPEVGCSKPGSIALPVLHGPDQCWPDMAF